MAPRQAHVLRDFHAGTAAKSAKPRSGKGNRGLDALAIAEREHPDRIRLKRSRFGQDEDESRSRRQGNKPETNDSSDEDEEDEHKTKRSRYANRDDRGNEIEVQSDSSGNEWITGAVDSEDDSDVDSDEAFGESDEERFDGYTFRGSSTTKRKDRLGPARDDEDEEFVDLDEPTHEREYESGEESEDFAENAIDLADALDQSVSDTTDVEDNGSEDEHKSQVSWSDLEDDEEENFNKLDSLQKLVSQLGNGDGAEQRERLQQRLAQESHPQSLHGITAREKLTVDDLFLPKSASAFKASKKLLADNRPSVASGKGIPGKLSVPLPRRQKDKLDRQAAYEKSKETLNRWIETVKQNRRSEHLSFPLRDLDKESDQNTKTLAPVAKPFNELESAIQAILTESGLASTNDKASEETIRQAEEGLATKKQSLEEIKQRQADLRRERDLLFREEIRAKRIKKIKSKSYRRVHRKEKERIAEREREAREEAGIPPSEDEQERLDRLRAEERMGARHRESKWAKSMKATGRAAWDENARDGAKEMVRRDEELRRRILGKDAHDQNEIGGSDSESESFVDSDDEEGYTSRLRQRLDDEEENDNEESSRGLANMKFMKVAAAAQKKRNDEDAERLRRELAGEDPLEDEGPEEPTGRRSYGPKANSEATTTNPFRMHNEFEERNRDDGFDDEENVPYPQRSASIVLDHDPNQANSHHGKTTKSGNLSIAKNKSHASLEEEPAESSNPWLSIAPKRGKSNASSSTSNVLIDANPTPDQISNKAAVRDSETKSTSKSKGTQTKKSQGAQDLANKTNAAEDSEYDSDASVNSDLPPNPLTRNQELIKQAFSGDDVVTDFAAEKALQTREEHSPSPDSTVLPGWGSWTGAGVSSSRRQNKILAAEKAEHAAKRKAVDATRKDAKLKNVIISEKRMSKSAKYLASQLPHQYENKAQYERSLRLPVGPEWSTKETFMKATTPRVILKGGIVQPMRKPLV